MQQTICRKLRYTNIQNTIQINYLILQIKFFNFFFQYFSIYLFVIFIGFCVSKLLFCFNFVSPSKFNEGLVKKSVYHAYNPQITKASIFKLYQFDINFYISMLLGFLEAICLLFFYSELYCIHQVDQIYYLVKIIFSLAIGFFYCTKLKVLTFNKNIYDYSFFLYYKVL